MAGAPPPCSSAGWNTRDDRPRQTSRAALPNSSTAPSRQVTWMSWPARVHHRNVPSRPARRSPLRVGVRQPGVLQDRQRVHVRAQQHGRPWTAPSTPTTPVPPIRSPPRVRCRRARRPATIPAVRRVLRERELGMGVQVDVDVLESRARRTDAAARVMLPRWACVGRHARTHGVWGKPGIWIDGRAAADPVKCWPGKRLGYETRLDRSDRTRFGNVGVSAEEVRNESFAGHWLRCVRALDPAAPAGPRLDGPGARRRDENTRTGTRARPAPSRRRPSTMRSWSGTSTTGVMSGVAGRR